MSSDYTNCHKIHKLLMYKEVMIVGCSSAHTVCYEDFYESYYEESYESIQCHLTQQNCVIETIKRINKLQKTPPKTTKFCSNCDKPYLGYYSRANTRPIIIYLENGKPFEVVYLDQIGLEPTPIFRIEEVKGTCATLRALAYKDCSDYPKYEREESQLVATRTCVTININVIKAIQCLDDVYLNLTDC